MNAKEFRNSAEYKECVEKIKCYRKGFRFTINFSVIPKAKANALEIVLNDCCKIGLIESVSIGLALNGDVVDETYVRL